jgi:hypothetical protein
LDPNGFDGTRTTAGFLRASPVQPVSPFPSIRFFVVASGAAPEDADRWKAWRLEARDPGAENGRPLLQPAEGIWELTDDYLAPK